MRYPKPTDRYSCEVLCENFMEIDERLVELEENDDGSALPPVTESDNGNILQVVDGAWMIVDGSGLGGSGVYVGSGEMPEGYNVQIDPSGEVTPIGSSEWADIKNKPFETVGGDTLIWDGDTEGKTVVDGIFVHVSDATPSIGDFSNGGSFTEMNTNGVSTFTNSDISGDESIVMPLTEPLFVVIRENNVEWEGITFPDKGVYFFCLEGSFITTSLTINGYTGFATEKLKASALPSNLVTRADLEEVLGTYIDEVAELLGGEA